MLQTPYTIILRWVGNRARNRLGAIFLLGFFGYVTVDYLLSQRRHFTLSFSAYVKLALLGGIVVTGAFRVLKNLPHIVFSPNFTLFVDIAHLGFMMIYLLTALLFLILKSRWLVRRTF